MATFFALHLDSQHHDNAITQQASTTKQGPSAEDWDRVRTIIKGLYIDEDRRLKDVMGIMADEYGHKATVKMYKFRFTKWNLDKHHRQPDMRFVVRKKTARDAERKKSTFLVRDKEVSAQEIDRSAQRKHVADPTLLATPQDYRHIRAWTPSPSVPCVVTPPDTLRRFEMLFADIPSYVEESIARGAWYADTEGRLTTLKTGTIHPVRFFDFCDEAIMHFEQSSVVQGRRLLSKAFSMLPTLLREAHHTLLESVVNCLLRMGHQGFVGIAAMIQNHLVELTRTTLPERDIRRRICISLFHFELDQAEVLTRAWRCHADAIVNAAGRLSMSSVACQVDMINRLYRFTDPQRAEKFARELLADYEQTTQKLDDTALYVVETLAYCLRDQGKHAEMELVIEGALWRAREAGCLSRGREAGLLKRLAWAQYELFKYHLAEESMWSAIALYAENCGTDDPNVIGCCRELESWLRGWGRRSEADELLVKMDEMIGLDEIDFETTVL